MARPRGPWPYLWPTWGGPAGAGHVSARSEIVVLSQAIGTKVDLVYLAMNHRHVAMANITAAPNPSLCVFGFS